MSLWVIWRWVQWHWVLWLWVIWHVTQELVLSANQIACWAKKTTQILWVQVFSSRESLPKKVVFQGFTEGDSSAGQKLAASTEQRSSGKSREAIDWMVLSWFWTQKLEINQQNRKINFLSYRWFLYVFFWLFVEELHGMFQEMFSRGSQDTSRILETSLDFVGLLKFPTTFMDKSEPDWALSIGRDKDAGQKHPQSTLFYFPSGKF